MRMAEGVIPKEDRCRCVRCRTWSREPSYAHAPR